MDEPPDTPTGRLTPRVVGLTASFLLGTMYGYWTGWNADPERYQGQSSPAMNALAVFVLASAGGLLLLGAVGAVAAWRSRSCGLTLAALALVGLGFIAGLVIESVARPDPLPPARSGALLHPDRPSLPAARSSGVGVLTGHPPAPCPARRDRPG